MGLAGSNVLMLVLGFGSWLWLATEAAHSDHSSVDYR